jgi:hypothetical protein
MSVPGSGKSVKGALALHPSVRARVLRHCDARCQEALNAQQIHAPTATERKNPLQARTAGKNGRRRR